MRSRDADRATLCGAVERDRLDKVSPQRTEFDLRAENAYYGVPFPLLNCAKRLTLDKGVAVPEGGLLIYGANAGCNVETDAGFP